MSITWPDLFLPQQIGIEYDHFKLHQGQVFNCSYFFTNTAANGINEISIEVPSDIEFHTKMQMAVEFKAEVSLLEDVTVTVNGNSITVFNMKRDSGVTSSAIVFANPTAATGTAIDVFLIGSAGFRGGFGGQARHNTEWILEDNKYLMRAKNISATTSCMAFNVQFYIVQE